ncbi:unnamed protein product [Protopolystoma xenopodis]|uniref:Uncharacterized protein n=1 Tax=Protopolystoma xenopodis TaxID=117903 RepID=A0A3S5AVC6_9PLAT|nr:unnamed protein product [Protopolystoma xenopodis]
MRKCGCSISFEPPPRRSGSCRYSLKPGQVNCELRDGSQRRAESNGRSVRKARVCGASTSTTHHDPTGRDKKGDWSAVFNELV